MSSKIEVSREKLELVLIYGCETVEARDAWVSLQAELDTPVVERQPIVLPRKMEPSQYDSKGSVGLREGWNGFHDTISKLGPLYTAPPELAELQATIARLTAENERLKVFESVEQLSAEIERLKGGQGEPVACTSCDGSGEYIDAIGDWRGYCSCPAGIELKSRPSQPAPVSVVLPERMVIPEPKSNLSDMDIFDYEVGFNACLDKVKELNQ